MTLEQKDYTLYEWRAGKEDYLITDSRTKRMSEKCSLSAAGVNNWFLIRTENRWRIKYSSVGAVNLQEDIIVNTGNENEANRT